MPKTAATALWPTAAAQIVAMSRPRAVADRMIASGAPRTPAGTTPTIARPSATEPAMKTARPSMAGSPAIGPTTGGAAGASCATAGRPDSPAVASTVVISSLLHGESAPRIRAQCIHTPDARHMCSHFEPQWPSWPASAQARGIFGRVSAASGGSSGSAAGRDDAVLVDLAVDSGPGHAQRLGRPDLVAVVVLQALHDRVPLDRLQRGQQPAAHRPALRGQVARHNQAGPAALHDLFEDVPEQI